jgi:hypothetical protein
MHAMGYHSVGTQHTILFCYSGIIDNCTGLWDGREKRERQTLVLIFYFNFSQTGNKFLELMNLTIWRKEQPPEYRLCLDNTKTPGVGEPPLWVRPKYSRQPCRTEVFSDQSDFQHGELRIESAAGFPPRWLRLDSKPGLTAGFLVYEVVLEFRL